MLIVPGGTVFPAIRLDLRGVLSLSTPGSQIGTVPDVVRAIDPEESTSNKTFGAGGNTSPVLA